MTSNGLIGLLLTAFGLADHSEVSAFVEGSDRIAQSLPELIHYYHFFRRHWTEKRRDEHEEIKIAIKTIECQITVIEVWFENLFTDYVQLNASVLSPAFPEVDPTLVFSDIGR